MEIILNGNLTIADGGILTLTNVTLRVNCNANGSNYIRVESRGAFYINDTDGNPSTRNDASNITALNPRYRYLFQVLPGATFQMNNSELHYCGHFFTDILTSLTAILLLLTSNSQSGFSLLIYAAAGVAACTGVAAVVLFYYFRLRRA